MQIIKVTNPDTVFGTVVKIFEDPNARINRENAMSWIGTCIINGVQCIVETTGE